MTEMRERLWDQHTPMEATGGYIECSCGWPEKDEWESGMHYAEHLLADVWDECVKAVAWALDNGPAERALPHVRENNPYREVAQ